MKSFKQVEYELHESVVKMQSLLARVGDKGGEDYRALEETKRLIAEKTYVVAIMGEFKRGKSSLINGLLGSSILPADVEPTTATLNRITYADAPQVLVRYEDGSTRDIGISDLSAYVTKQGLDGSAEAAHIEEVTVGYPVPFTQNHIDIYDTPGLNDDERMTAIAIRMVEKADMVLVPISALAPFSEVEQDFVCRLIRNEHIDHLMFVVTFLDMLGEDGIDYNYQRLMFGHGGIAWRIKELTFQRLAGDEAALARAHRMLDDLNLCAVSSKLALSAYATNNRSLLAESHFEDFRNQLVQTLTSRQMIATMHKAARELERASQLVEEAYDQRLASLQRRREGIDAALARLVAYPTEVRRIANIQLGQAYEADRKAMSAVRLWVADTTRCYIVELAALHAGDAASVRGACEKGSRACQELVRQRLADVTGRLSDTFRATVEALADNERELVSDLSNVPDVLLLSRNDVLVQQLLGYMETTYTSLEFEVRNPLAHLSLEQIDECDPIVYVRGATGLMLDDLVRRLEASTAQIRARFLKRLATYADSLVRWAEINGHAAAHDVRQDLHLCREEQARARATADGIVARARTLAGEARE